MHKQHDIWRQWAAGEMDDQTAQTAAEAYQAHKANAQGPAAGRPPNAPAGFSGAAGRGKREKVFGPGRCTPMDRNSKCRIMVLARALSHRQEKGRAYGVITAKFVAVLGALIWGFHNAATGKCFPSYEAIAEAAGCARSTVYEAIRALEQVGLLSWQNRIKRVREFVPGLFGKDSAWRWRVIRTSNAYVLIDPLASKSDLQTGTASQGFKPRKLLQLLGQRSRNGIMMDHEEASGGAL